jgi:hypothetical protein
VGYTQPPIQRIPRAFSPEVKRSGREADQIYPSNAKVMELSLWRSARLIKYRHCISLLSVLQCHIIGLYNGCPLISETGLISGRR